MLPASFWYGNVSATIGFDAHFVPRSGKRAFVRRAFLFNNSGSAGRVGIGSRFGIQTVGGVYTKYECGQIGATGVYTRDTTDFIDAGANDFAVSTTVDNTGCILAAYQPWNFAKIVVGTAEGGVAGVYAYQYWNGTAWTALTPVDTLDWASATTQYLRFNLPIDWAMGGTDDAGNAISELVGKYALKVKATTAPTVAGALVTSGLLGTIQDMRRVAAGAEAEIASYMEQAVAVVGDGDSFTVLWPAADATNYVSITGEEKL